MLEKRSAESVRATIALQGSGRLTGVSQVLKVKLEPKEIQWEPVDERTLAVRGEIHSYMYFLRSGSREIQGEGLSIPFARKIDAPGLTLREVEVTVEDLASEYDYDPVTTDFQHRITLVLRIDQKKPIDGAPKEKSEGPTDERPEEHTDAQAYGEAEEPAPPRRRPDQAPMVQVAEASGETSDIDSASESGELVLNGPAEVYEPAAAPSPARQKATEPAPSATKLSPQTQARAPGPTALGSTSGQTRISQVRLGPSPSADPHDQVIESPHPPADRSQETERRCEQVLVWKPFPPPIDG